MCGGEQSYNFLNQVKVTVTYFELNFLINAEFGAKYVTLFSLIFTPICMRQVNPNLIDIEIRLKMLSSSFKVLDD